MYSELRDRFSRERKKSKALRRVNPAKQSIVELYVASALWGERVASAEEVDSIPAADLERAVERALSEFPTWGVPEKAPPRASAEERLESANRELARKPDKKPPQPTSPASPAAKREALAKLPADIRLAIANGEKLYGFNADKKDKK